MGVSGGAMFLAKEQLGITEVEVEVRTTCSFWQTRVRTAAVIP